jgi:methylenetetrahydrofolate reductase (NADPH)
MCLCVGFAVYPDGHPNIPAEGLFQAALDKQRLLAACGVQGSATTQICFNPSQTIAWIEEARKAGFHTPIMLGLPGKYMMSFFLICLLILILSLCNFMID